jgi:hypothetical protein
MQVIFEELEVRMVKVNIDDKVLKRREELLANGLCLGCEEPTKDKLVRRGLCPACYQAMLRALKGRKKTRTELIQKGQLLDRGQRGPKSTNKFTRELSGR